MNRFRWIGGVIPTSALRALQDRFVYGPVIRQRGLTVDLPPLFDSLFFEVRTRCNGHCAFCTASVENDTRADVSMSIDMHDRILREAAAAGFRGRIAYHNNSEPLIFRDLPLFVEHAKALIPHAHVQILSNGRALTVEKAHALIRAGIDELSINFYNDDLRRKLPPVFHEVAATVLPQYFTPDEVEIRGLGNDRINPSARFRYSVARRLENVVLTSRAGTAPNKKTPDAVPRGFCQYPWTQFIVSADGRVPTCCCDVNISQPVGNVHEQSVTEIWNGERYQSLRAALWRGDRQAFSTCRMCDFYGLKKPPSGFLAKAIYALTR